ncbi:autotransporter outer membrane beta-barrel domain-containing protein, partial [Halocynthiibacter namhaensis]|uniref:autotransporter outer membrane beta-barrel domain-containing protein n=1 Tax=Halocynthiibacter namhaensis TaxID=1290553 RepID=UPI001EE31DE0
MTNPSATLSGDNGVVAVVGNADSGVPQNATNTATATTIMNGGSIFVGAMDTANGLGAINLAMGGAEVMMTGGSVTTEGFNANAVMASVRRHTNNTSSAIATVVGGTVNTIGVNSAGVAGYNNGLGLGRADVRGGTEVLVTGMSSSAVSVRSRRRTEVYIEGPGTVLTATNADSSGILVRQLDSGASGTFDVFVGDGVVVTGGQGVDSAGIEIDSQTGNTGIVQIANGATIGVGVGARAGIWDKDGDAIVTSAGLVNGVPNGIAIDTGDGEDTVNLIAGSVTNGDVDTGSEDDIVNVVSATSGVLATLNGGIITGSGEDTVILADGSVVTDGLDTGDDNDTFTIGSNSADVASLAGGIDAGFGDDSGALLMGSVVAGDILMNRGSDDLTIDGGADITGATMIDGGDDASIADGEIDILHLNGGTRSFDGGDLTNWETVNLTGGADITFSGSALVTGSATGTGPHGQPYGLTVQSGATARFDGNFTVDGNLNNAGTVDLTLDGAVGTQLNVQSNYVGTAGSSFLIDVNLDDGGPDNAPATDLTRSDLMVVQGNASGSTNVFVSNLAGLGAITDINQNDIVDPGEGILFARVEGTSTAGLFSLGGPATVGAFTYDLVALDPANDPSKTFWEYVLANRFSTPSEGYETYPRAVMFTMPTLHQRVGNRHWKGNLQPEVAGTEIFCKDPEQNYRCTLTEEQASYYDDEILIEENSGWVRIVGSHARIAPTFSTTGVNYNIETVEIQAGIDRLLRESDEGNKWIGGLNAQISTSGVAGTDPSGDASMKATGLGIGGTLTYYKPNGFYTDIQARLMAVSTDFSSASSGSYDNARAVVASASVE